MSLNYDPVKFSRALASTIPVLSSRDRTMDEVQSNIASIANGWLTEPLLLTIQGPLSTADWIAVALADAVEGAVMKNIGDIRSNDIPEAVVNASLLVIRGIPTSHGRDVDMEAKLLEILATRPHLPTVLMVADGDGSLGGLCHTFPTCAPRLHGRDFRLSEDGRVVVTTKA